MFYRKNSLVFWEKRYSSFHEYFKWNLGCDTYSRQISTFSCAKVTLSGQLCRLPTHPSRGQDTRSPGLCSGQIKPQKARHVPIVIVTWLLTRIILIAPCAVEVCYVHKEVRGIRSNVLNVLQMWAIAACPAEILWSYTGHAASSYWARRYCSHL